jgi:hypothetical protein
LTCLNLVGAVPLVVRPVPVVLVQVDPDPVVLAREALV